MTKVCIADNHPVVLHGLKSYFNNNNSIEVVKTVSSLKEIRSFLENRVVDVLVLDIELNGVSGIRDIKNLIKEFPNSKVVLFTSVSEKMYAPTAIKSGVSAYILKTASLKELETAVIRVSNGITVISEAVEKVLRDLNKGKKTDRLFKKLSIREVEVLRYLNDGKKNKEIALTLNLDEKTISTYKLRLLAKLDVTNLVDLLSKAKSLDII